MTTKFQTQKTDFSGQATACKKPYRLTSGELACCWCFDCQEHGHAERNRRFIYYSGKLPCSLLFSEGVLHLNCRPTASELGTIARKVISAVKKVASVIDCVLVPHYDQDDWNLHLGIWHDLPLDSSELASLVEQQAKIVCNTIMLVRREGFLERKDPVGFLSYCLRTDPSGKPYSPPPQGKRYRLLYGEGKRWRVPPRIKYGKRRKCLAKPLKSPKDASEAMKMGDAPSSWLEGDLTGFLEGSVLGTVETDQDSIGGSITSIARDAEHPARPGPPGAGSRGGRRRLRGDDQGRSPSLEFRNSRS